MPTSFRFGSVLLTSLAGAAVLAACSSTTFTVAPDPKAEGTTPDSDRDAATAPIGFTQTTLAAEPQRPGDPDKGYRALVNNAYVPCGIPYTAFAQGFAPVPKDLQIPGREGDNAELPYNFTAMTTAAGVKIVTSNCLSCHAGRINGKVVVGLGAADGDFTADQSQQAEAVGFLLTDPAERAEWRKWADRVQTIAPWAVLDTVGVNPADSFTAVLFAHHDAKTLAWSNTPLMSLPEMPVVIPVDVPPWWRMKKKAAMFYNGAGRGDHARIMMTASILCTSTVEESREIDAYFPHIEAWIKSLTAPKYPFAVDAALAEKGRGVFDATCSRCHGTYGEQGRYPNKLVSLPEIGTDALLASGQAQFAPTYVAWMKASYFGEVSRLEPHEGYVAPPLDGIWATAPYLHNGSVPTIAALLDSTQRPRFWKRTFDSSDYDPTTLGWRFSVVDHGKDGEAGGRARKQLYDTTRVGYGNAGHTFGDALSAQQRLAVLEYLKTL